MRTRWSSVRFILNSVRIKNSRHTAKWPHYDQAFRNYTEIASSNFEEPFGVGVKVGNICAEGRWFGTKEGAVWQFYYLNSTSSFLSAVFHYYCIFPQIIPMLFSSDDKPFAGNDCESFRMSVMYDLRLRSVFTVSGQQSCVVPVRRVLCCCDKNHHSNSGTTAEQPMNQEINCSRKSVCKLWETHSLVTMILPSSEL